MALFFFFGVGSESRTSGTLLLEGLSNLTFASIHSGIYGGGHLLLRLHRVRHHSNDRRGGAQSPEKHPESNRGLIGYRPHSVRYQQLHPDTSW